MILKNLILQYIQPSKILRRDRMKVVTVSAYTQPGVTAMDIIQQFRPWIDRERETWPLGYSYEFGGELESSVESQQSIMAKMPITFGIIILLLVAQFNSFRRPVIILLTIPLAGVGAVILLLILGMAFNIMSYIGIIMLAGIAVNDSIILVDRINRNRRGGEPLETAIVNAGQTRIRPIVMTSVTTILALLPLTIGIGEGASLRAPMAVAVIGGLFSSTLLTLVVIPAVYRLLAGKIKPDTETLAPTAS